SLHLPHFLLLVLFLMFRPPPHLTPFPYTTLFRSRNMSLGSMLAGLAFSQTGTTASHAMSYYLTSHFNIPHGEAYAFSLDEWFVRSEEHTSELQSRFDLVCRLLLEKNNIHSEPGTA